MGHKYNIGQKVIITTSRSQTLSPRDASLEPFAGKIGTVSNYYWVGKAGGSGVFCVYTVRVEPGRKQVVLHEDELEPCPG